MSEQLDVLLDVVARLDTAGVPYMLSGSVAMNYYAQPRMTRDIDVVVELAEAGVAAVEAEFRDDYYVDAEAGREAVANRGMFNLIHLESLVKIDLIVRKDGEYRQLEFARRRKVDLGGATVVIVAPEDLLLSKLAWGKESRSELQMRDARNLLLAVAGLDGEYLREWAVKLGVSEMLEELRE